MNAHERSPHMREVLGLLEVIAKCDFSFSSAEHHNFPSAPIHNLAHTG